MHVPTEPRSPFATGVAPPPGGAMTAEAYRLGIDAESTEHGAVVRLSGELDPATAPALEAALERVRGECGPNVVVDAAGLTFLDSTGLRALLTGAQACVEAGGSLHLVHPKRAIRRVLEVSGVADRLLNDGRR